MGWRVKALRAIAVIISFLWATSVFAQYSIIIDAGSSGSRIHLFQYQTMPTIKKLPVVTDVFNEKIKPGLSSYADRPSDAGESLKPLLDDAAKQLKAKHIPQRLVSISVMATAGMRLLPEETQHAIYQDVKDYIQSNYHFRVETIETISGKMEGVYGWIDINYLAGHFNGKKVPTYGSIDMGGASTEIAFATDDLTQPQDEVKVTINRKTYTIFSQSYLGLGEDQALASINLDANANQCYPIDYVLPNMQGQFNYQTCGSLYTDLIKQFHVSDMLIPLPSLTFIAYSGANYVANFFQMGDTFNQDALENNLQTTCLIPWNQMQFQYPNESPQYLSVYCADAVLMDKLFFDTYHLQKDQLLTTSQINNQNIDWALGAMLYQLVTK